MSSEKKDQQKKDKKAKDKKKKSRSRSDERRKDKNREKDKDKEKNKDKDKNRDKDKDRKSDKDKDKVKDKDKSRDKDKDKEKDRKKSSKKKSSHKKRSRSRSEKKSRKDKHRSRRSRSRSRSHRKRRERRHSHSSSRSRSPSQATKRKEFLRHYQDQIQNKGRTLQNFKHENAGLIYDGFHWISPDVQSHKILRSVTVFGLPLDKCAFSDQHLQEFLTQFMKTNSLSDSSNLKPIVSCKINQEQKTALVEFSSFEECNRFAILGKIQILEKECKIVKQHTSNPYNQQQGLEQAVNQGIVQATIMKAMEQIKGDLTEEKKNFYKNQNQTVPGLIKQETKLEENQQNEQQQSSSQQQQKPEVKSDSQAQPNLPPLPVTNKQNNQQQQAPIQLPPLPGQGQKQGILGLNLPQILTQSQAQQYENNLK